MCEYDLYDGEFGCLMCDVWDDLEPRGLMSTMRVRFVLVYASKASFLFCQIWSIVLALAFHV
jgi:hypothetical protein